MKTTQAREKLKAMLKPEFHNYIDTGIAGDFAYALTEVLKSELEKTKLDHAEWIDKAKKLAGEYAHCYAFVGDDTMPRKHKELMDHLENLPQQQKPLSEEEIIKIAIKTCILTHPKDLISFVRAIESAHGIS